MAGTFYNMGRLLRKELGTGGRLRSKPASGRLAKSGSPGNNRLGFRMRFRKGLVLIMLSFIAVTQGSAVDKYLIYFSDKENLSFDPLTYFDPRTIERRKKQGIPLSTYTDWPVNEQYVARVEQIVSRVLFKSRWLNAVSVYATRQDICTIRGLAFVDSIQPVTPFLLKSNTCDFPFFNYDRDYLLEEQMEHLEGNAFIDKGISGQGIRIAVFDAGYKNARKNPALAHLFENQQIIKCHDFIDGDADVFEGLNHGTMVLSCITGKKGDRHLGLATGAEFLLARTEKLFEIYTDEENWLRAAEWADKHGADIISSSLGYAYHRYTTADMDGNSSTVAKAAQIAASKGILVVNSAGNSGNSRWEIITTPADVERVLTVGGIAPKTGAHIFFSSVGPTADYRMKPNLSAMGEAMVGKGKRLTRAFGTSFACPLVTGFAACVWSMSPDLTNQELFTDLEKSGHLYPYFDYAHGYGIPKAGYFFQDSPAGEKLFSTTRNRDRVWVAFRDTSGRQPDGKSSLLYYHLVDTAGILREYATLKPDNQEKIGIRVDTSRIKTVRVHYHHVTDTIRISNHKRHP